LLAGLSGADTLRGGAGVDTVQGGSEADILYGDDGNDTLSGDDGADRLTGGLGADVLRGGAGADRFIFGAAAESTVNSTGRDRILDFDVAGGDLIDLSAMDAVVGGADDAFTLVAAFTGVAGQLVAHDRGLYSLVTADTNGDGLADFSIYVLAADPLTGGDFVL
jgi:serralysin